MRPEVLWGHRAGVGVAGKFWPSPKGSEIEYLLYLKTPGEADVAEGVN